MRILISIVRVVDLSRFGNQLFNSVSHAHNSIIEGCDDVWEVGTTTLIGGVLLEIEPNDPTTFQQEVNGPMWAFICVSVGYVVFIE